MDKNCQAEEPPKKGFKKWVNLLIYLGSLMVALPLILFFSFLISLLITGDQGSILTIVIFLVLLPFYTWLFFFMARSGFGFNRIKTDKTKRYDLVSRRNQERSHDTKKTVTLGLGWLILGGMFGLPLIVGFIGWLIQFMGLSGGNNDTLTWFLLVVSSVFMLVIFSFFARRSLLVKSLGRTVLWLRRFHQNGLFPFDLVLDNVCRGIALPITVADTTVPKSELTGQLHPLFSVGFLLIGLAFMGGFAAQAFFPLKQIAFVSIPLGLSGVLLLNYGRRIGGRKDLRNNDSHPIITRIFNAIDQKLPIPSTLTVVRLSDENWQNWVGAFIDRADAVILDVTYLNENLGWELNACRERLSPSSLILACCRNQKSEEDPWLILKPELERFLGADFLAGCHKFNYYRPHKVIEFISRYPGLRTSLAWYLRKKYEQDLLFTISAAFAERDKTHEQSIN